MLPTNQNLSQWMHEHEQVMRHMDDQTSKKELGKIYPRFSRLAPTLALLWFRADRWIRWKWASPLAYAIRFEFHHILARIRFQASETPCSDMSAGHRYQKDPNGHWCLDSGTQTRIQNMQSLAANHSWFGIAEQWAFHLGWEAGAKWAESNSRNLHTE
jgi:hypothetical protein